MKETVFLIGSNGQIGTELALALRQKFGNEHVITSDIRAPKNLSDGEIFETIDVLDKARLKELFVQYKPTQIYLLAAMLSAVGEQYPQKAWDEYERLAERIGLMCGVGYKQNILAKFDRRLRPEFTESRHAAILRNGSQ